MGNLAGAIAMESDANFWDRWAGALVVEMIREIKVCTEQVEFISRQDLRHLPVHRIQLASQYP